MSDFDAEVPESVAQRVKGTTRKRKTPSSLRSPMMIFKDVKKRNNEASQPSSPKMKRAGSTTSDLDDKIAAMKKKIKSTATRMSHLRRDMDYKQADKDALTPQEVAAVQYITNLCANIETGKRRVVRTELTSHTSLSANDLKGHTIPRNSDEPDSEKYVCNGVIDAYAGYLSLRMTDNRRFCPVWNAFILSNEVQVDRVLKPEIREEYTDFAARFYDHDMVFFPLQLTHRGHRHWILVVMNNDKREFQVLDSLWTLEMYMAKIEMMRTGIERMTSYSRRTFPHLPANVGTWAIRPIRNLPQQTDGYSCGLFVLKYMELWNGTRLVRDFTQDDIHVFRMKILAAIICSPTNDMEDSKEGVENIIKALDS